MRTTPARWPGTIHSSAWSTSPRRATSMSSRPRRQLGRSSCRRCAIRSAGSPDNGLHNRWCRLTFRGIPIERRVPVALLSRAGDQCPEAGIGTDAGQQWVTLEGRDAGESVLRRISQPLHRELRLAELRIHTRDVVLGVVIVSERLLIPDRDLDLMERPRTIAAERSRQRTNWKKQDFARETPGRVLRYLVRRVQQAELYLCQCLHVEVPRRRELSSAFLGDRERLLKSTAEVRGVGQVHLGDEVAWVDRESAVETGGGLVDHGDVQQHDAHPMMHLVQARLRGNRGRE